MAVPVADRAGSPATRAPAPSPRRRLVLLLVAVGLVLVVVVAAALAYRSLRAPRAAAPGRPRHSPLAMPLPPPKVERVPGPPFGPDGTRLVVPAGQTAEEVFITGGARYFRPAGRWTRDGRWRVRTSTATAIYTTRLVIVRPAEDAAFNGAVVLDWIGTALAWLRRYRLATSVLGALFGGAAPLLRKRGRWRRLMLLAAAGGAAYWVWSNKDRSG